MTVTDFFEQVVCPVVNKAPCFIRSTGEIFLPGQKDPLSLLRSSQGLQLLQRLRDEAHRFAVSYYSRVHRKQTFSSVLDGIPGIGPRRKSALIRHFGSVQGIREATVEELAASVGMTGAQAKRVKEYL